MDTLDPKNLTALLNHRGRGNPPGSQPASAIANCFPGLEFDFRNVWKQAFLGLELHESTFRVVAVSDPALTAQRVEPGAFFIGATIPAEDGAPARRLRFFTEVVGPDASGTVGSLGFSNLEWTGSLAEIIAERQGKSVLGRFARGVDEFEVELQVRNLLDDVWLPESLGEPGALTQGLCSPWQADYRECGCYYWAASRPDFVNVDDADPARGHEWLVKDKDEGNRDYASGAARVSYEELYRGWEAELGFIVGGEEQS